MTATARVPATRSVPLSVRLLRVGFAVASRVAPTAAERHAAMLTLTPRRRQSRESLDQRAKRVSMEMNAGGFPVVGWSLGEGPTVLLVHGWSGLAADMSDLATGLARGGYRAVAFDMPAHGASPGRRTSLLDWMRVLPSLAEKLGGLHAVVAHSFGATATTLSLGAGLRARGAVLIGAARGPAWFLDRIQRYIGLPQAHRMGMGRQLVAHLGKELSDFDASTAAATIEVPALFLHDPKDREVPYEQARAIAAAWRGSRVVESHGEGHTRILGSSAVVRQAVDFVHGLTDPSAERRTSSVEP